MRGRRTRRPARRKPHPRRGTVILVAATALCLIAGLAFLFVARSLRLRDLERGLVQLREDQVAALERQEELRDELAKRDDPETIEKHAREDLGLVMPGEEKVLFIEGE